MSESLENLKQILAQAAFGSDRKKSMSQKICVRCQKSATEFKDKVSEREYAITGFCQACQDQLFPCYRDEDE